MMEVLSRAAETVGTRRSFGARDTFSRRVGKQRVFPIGLGSALEKAVRQGYLRVLEGGTRRRGRAYEFTPEGRQALEQHRTTRSGVPDGSS